MSNTSKPDLSVGNRVTVRIGGQTHEMTIGDRIMRDGAVEAIRSTTDSDHVWTKLWVQAGCVQS